MKFNHLQRLREYELSLIIPHLKAGEVLLELGAGAGWQAQILDAKGWHVDAIDIEDSYYADQRVWPVTVYDGHHIPFPDGHFDVVFSSNVLEHIAHIEVFQTEIQRVLKPGGRAIHLMPSPSWRFWTIVSGYPALIKKVFQRLLPKKPSGTSYGGALPLGKIGRGLRNMLLPPRHGEIGNTLDEFYLFSARRWRDIFMQTGWQVEQIFPNRLFYTGWNVFGDTLSLQTRQRLSHPLGSACIVYMLRRS